MEMHFTPDEITRLSPPERIALIAQLWDSLEDEQLPLTPAQKAELDRRLSTLDHDRQGGVTWAADDTLLVIACFHGSRDPLHWQKRT
jgi:putative addiction module component (TIGR02574 family)